MPAHRLTSSSCLQVQYLRFVVFYADAKRGESSLRGGSFAGALRELCGSFALHPSDSRPGQKPTELPGDEVASCELTLAKVVGCAPNTIHALVPKGGGGHPGGLRILHEELSGCKGRLVARVAAVGKLANRAGWFGTNRAYYVLSKAREDALAAPLLPRLLLFPHAGPAH